MTGQYCRCCIGRDATEHEGGSGGFVCPFVAGDGKRDQNLRGGTRGCARRAGVSVRLCGGEGRETKMQNAPQEGLR
ncbi:hypothetical protein, partial [Bowmanella yangjiangensis]